MKDKLLRLILTWKREVSDNQEMLYELGEKAHTLQYNLLSTETLSLYRCIVQAQEILLEHDQ